MAQLRVCALLLLLIITIAVKCDSGISTTLGDSVKLTASKNCTGVTESKLMTGDITVPVAKLVNGTWMAQPGYEGRIKHHSTCSLVLTQLNYNDNGLFEFFCGGSVVTLTQLEVVVSYKSVPEGGQATLPCHSLTARRPAQLIRWEKDGALVIEWDPSSGGIRYGAGFKGNVSISPERYLSGDISLTLARAQPEDQAVYWCYTQEKDGRKQRGNPAAVRLIIERPPDQILSTPPHPPSSQTPSEMGDWTNVGIAAGGISIALIFFFCGWGARSYRLNGSPCGGSDVETPSNSNKLSLILEYKRGTDD
ncbi:uncharacterized protein LOC115005823 [Cottoperca gobio]|uniref:Uncharacterized protein LOC115005823 n=1 Tax=Cottoperca gobio TaxID=56716 RepID=A0A6J2PEV2_COTGO|nr:uncharacterized protein LOC115005823 [Cottoperca gobio]